MSEPDIKAIGRALGAAMADQMRVHLVTSLTDLAIDVQPGDHEVLGLMIMRACIAAGCQLRTGDGVHMVAPVKT